MLLAATPTHVLLGRVAFDFLFPLPFILGWLWALLVYLDTRQMRPLFVATSILGLGFYSYISSMLMMPKRETSASGTSIVAIVASAFLSMWNRSILA